MQVSIALYDRDRSAESGRSATPRFRLISQVSGDQSFDGQRTAYVHFANHTSVLGLEVGLSGDGEISLVGDKDQLHPEMVVTIRRHATEALEALGAPVADGPMQL